MATTPANWDDYAVDQPRIRQDEARSSNSPRYYRYKAQEDNSYTWAIRPAPGEFGATFGVRWLNSDQILRRDEAKRSAGLWKLQEDNSFAWTGHAIPPT